MRRRLKAFAIDPLAVVDLLSGRTRALDGPIPVDAKVERYGVMWETNTAIIVLSHESFPECEPGKQLQVIPVIGVLNT